MAKQIRFDMGFFSGTWRIASSILVAKRGLQPTRRVPKNLSKSRKGHPARSSISVPLCVLVQTLVVLALALKQGSITAFGKILAVCQADGC